MTNMNASKLKGLIEQYGRLGAPAPASGKGKKKPSLEELNQSRREHEALRVSIDAEIDHLYGVVDNVYPKEMFETFCETTQALVEQTQGIFIEALAQGADGPGVKKTADLFCRYNASVSEMVAFAEKRKTLPSWAAIAAIAGVGSLLMMNYLGNRKKPA